MTKIALFVLASCVLYGSLKFAVTGQPHVGEADLAENDEVENQNEQQGQDRQDQGRQVQERQVQAMAPAQGSSPIYRPRPNLSPNPVPVQLVECFVCTDCENVQPNTTSKLCPYTLDPTRQGRCVVYTEKYKHMKRPWYIRGCASERGSCADIRKAHTSHADIVTLKFCSECEGDRCNTNGASHSIADLTMAFFAMIVTPLIAKLTLS